LISKLGTVEEEADESGFWLEMLRHISQLGIVESDSQSLRELGRLEDQANQLVMITVASRKTARSKLKCQASRIANMENCAGNTNQHSVEGIGPVVVPRRMADGR
jgi:hypothetical protein